MGSTQEHVHGRFTGSLSRWRDQLAAGRPWSEVESEILLSCQGRIDLLMELLREAETRGPIAWLPLGRPWNSSEDPVIRGDVAAAASPPAVVPVGHEPAALG